MRVTQVIEGRKAAEVTVFAEGPDKFVPGTTYLLYLRPQRANGSVYSVVGYLSGLYERIEGQSGPGGGALFGRVDPESPDLPTGLEVREGKVYPVV